MDAVEFPFPVDVAAAPKLMGSEGFVRAGVAVMEVEGRGSDSVSIIVSQTIECCNSRLSEVGNAIVPDVINVKNDDEFPSRDEIGGTELCKNSSLLSHLQSEEVSKNLPAKGKNCPISASRLESMPLQRKAGKASRSNSSCLKRLRMSQSEDSMSLNGIEESKENKLAPHQIKCSSPDKSQLPKQKSNASKRGDKRNYKGSAKAKLDSSSMKLGAAIFSSASGGNNIFGLYGLKQDIHDFTKLMDGPPLDELLRGTVDCPSMSKDKGKKTSNTSESFFNSVRKACSVIQFPKPTQSQNMSEMDNFSHKKMSACQLSSVCVVEGGGIGDKGQSCMTDTASCQKDACKTETPSSTLDFPLYQPKDVLERIALPPSPDLESLLLDASKPAVTTKSNNDLRSGKLVHCRTNSDAVKLSTSRSTCQGKWARIGVSTSTMGSSQGCFTNLDSFTYNQSLVPSMGASDNKEFQALCASLPFFQCDSSSPVTFSNASQVTAEFAGQVDMKKKDGHCPRVLAAAQTLYEMATDHSLKQYPDGIVSWQRKTSHKIMKARNLKSNEKLEEMLSTPIGSELVVRSVEQITPSKKPRLSIVENKDDGHSNNVKKGPCSWPTSKSSRSLPSKSVRDSIMENKHSTPTILKQHCMMPPPARVLDKSCDRQQKVRKLVFTDWRRGRDKSD